MSVYVLLVDRPRSGGELAAMTGLGNAAFASRLRRPTANHEPRTTGASLRSRHIWWLAVDADIHAP